jgi:alpha-mannosidase
VPPLTFRRKNEQTAFTGSFVSLEPVSLTMTCLKMADDGHGIIIRLNNPVNAETRGIIRFARPIKEAFRATMNEKATGPLSLANGNEIELDVKPFEVVTIRFEM